MFDGIAGHYDFLNHFLSAGIDILWRKKAIRQLKDYNPQHILDIATGTGDLAIEALSLNPTKITGVDISEKMLEVGRKKLKTKSLEQKIELQKGDAENLPFEDETFDAVTVAFGVRNFENLLPGLKSMNRVLKKDWKVVILEFSNPKSFPVKQLYRFYFKSILPLVGKVISKHQSAYTYLPNSVGAFPDGKEFLKILESAGYQSCKSIPLTMGIATIYTGIK